MGLVFDDGAVAEEDQKAILNHFSQSDPVSHLPEEVAINAIMVLAEKIAERRPPAVLERLERVDDWELVVQVIHR
jgi:hypothetical protein